MPKFYLLLFLLLACGIGVFAQTDNSVVKVDSNMLKPGTKNKRPDSTALTATKPAIVKDSARLALEKMPITALRKSLILPGLGQIYNKQAWKLPFVYGGFVGIGLVYGFYQQHYSIALKELQYRLANNDVHKNAIYSPYGTSSIITVKDFYRRNRDLSIIAGVGFYALQAIDAYVKAKFARFDINDDLSLNIHPALQFNAFAYRPVPSLKFTLSLQPHL